MVSVLLSVVLGHAVSVLASGGWVEFDNQTARRLAADPAIGTNDVSQKAYAWADVDRDGDIDLVCVRKGPWVSTVRRRNVLFLNEGVAEGHAHDGVLVDRTDKLGRLSTDGGNGLLDETNDRSVLLVDVNNDGWVDIVTVPTLSDDKPKTLSHPRVYHNLGLNQGSWAGFLYREPAIPLLVTIDDGGPASPRFGALAAADVNDDGFVDLYFVNDDTGPTPFTDLNDRLLINDGTGFFHDETADRLTPSIWESAQGTAVAFADMNGDERPDLIKCEAGGSRRGVWIAYHHPTISGTFLEPVKVYDRSPLSLATGDLDSNGWTDLVITDEHTDRYLLHRGITNGQAGFLERVFFLEHGTDGGPGGNSLVTDLNNDEQPDVLITDVDFELTGCQRTLRAYRNLGVGDTPNGYVSLQELIGEPPWLAQGVHDVAVFDLNGDGWKDLIIGTCRGTQVWIARSPDKVIFSYPQGLPSIIEPQRQFFFSVKIEVASDVIVNDEDYEYMISRRSIDGDEFIPLPLLRLSGDIFEVGLPDSPCGETLRWYASVTPLMGDVFVDPPDAPTAVYATVAATALDVLLHDDFDDGEASDWTIFAENLSLGAWEAVDPRGTIHNGSQAAPNDDATRPRDQGRAFVTQNGPSSGPATLGDVDGGPTYLISPSFDFRDTDAFVSYARWFFCDDEGNSEADFLHIDVSNDDGQSWTPVEAVGGTGNTWEVTAFRVSDYVEPSAKVRVRFAAADQPNNSVTEAGIDDFQVLVFRCPEASGAIVSSDPPDGAIDARQPTDLSGLLSFGWDQIELTFEGNALGMVPSDFVVQQTGEGTEALAVLRTEATPPSSLRLILSEAISPGSRITITHIPSQSTITLGYLPGDVDGNGTSGPLDILALIDALNGVGTPRFLWSTDVNRSDRATPQDILREIDILNGAGAFTIWNGRSLP